MNVRALTICWLLTAAVAAPAHAQPLFDSWTTEDGLPQNSINDIAQTRDGYLWLATYGGLVRFDGSRFVVFDRSVDGIGSQRIRHVLEDRSGTLWAATEEGFLIRYRGGRFATFGPEAGLPYARGVVRLEEGADGHLWITSLSDVTRFDGGRAVTRGPSEIGHELRPPSLERHGELWWSHDAAGLHVLVAGEVQTVALDVQAVGAGVIGVNRDRGGNLWIRTNGAGTLRHRRGELRRFGVRDGFPATDRLASYFADGSARVWRAIGDRIYRIASGRSDLVNESGLLTLFDDREGSTWIGTNAGLLRVRDASFTTYSRSAGLSSNWVYATLETRSGTIWIGTWGGGVNRYERGRFTSFTKADGLPSDLVSTLYEDADGRLWAGTQTGLAYFDGRRFHRYRDPAGFLDAQVAAIIRDRDGVQWFGTAAGLVRLAGGRFSRYSIGDGLSNDRVTTIVTDRSGAMWIGALRGLTRFANGRFTAHGHDDGLDGTHVRAIYEDVDGVLWVGTYDAGLYRLAGNRFTRYTRNEGLHDNGIFQILEDGSGHLWMGSNRGISRVSRQELNDVAEGRRRSVAAIVFGAKDGLANAEVNGGVQPAGMKAADGRLWFPTMGGIAVVDPAAVRLDTRVPHAILEELRLAGRAVDFTHRITAAADASTLEIRFTAPSFVKPELVRFRYRLEGLDNGWVEADDARVATYHRIPPGSYRFTVIAANHHGVWNTAGSTVEIVVAPPFWRTRWFNALLAASLVTLIFADVRRRSRRLRRQHQQQTSFSQQLIDSQERERRRISSEMHDSLGQHLAVLRQRARTGLEPGSAQDPRQVLEEIVSVAGELDAEIKEIAYGLRPYQLDRLGLTKTIRMMVQRVGKQCGIDCAADVEPIDDAFAAAAHIHVFRIVQESVNNIVKHAQATRATVTARRERRTVVIRIEDNGRSFRPDAAEPDVLSNGGLGLMGIRERVRILGGTVDIRSTPGAGTALTMTLPVEEARHE